MYLDEDEDIATRRKGIERAEAIYGHLSFGVHETLGIPPRYAAIVRDPVDRVISFFRHIARDPASEFYGPIAEGVTLRELLDSEQCHQLYNSMVRVMSGHSDVSTVSDRRVLDRAISNMDRHFVAVGVTERMDESVAMIGKALGWQHLPMIPRDNVTPTSDRFDLDLDADTLAAILRFNTLDLELYEVVVRTWHGDAVRPNPMAYGSMLR